MSSFFEKRSYINLDLTFRCALECPRCLRSYYKNKNLKVPGEDLSLDILEKITDHYTTMVFCGQVSDPIFHPKFIDILKMIYRKNKRASVHTAASQKSMNWYIEAFKANPNARWTFGIDGLPEESCMYRVNQDGEKLYKVMLESKKHLKTKPVWQYIPFSYNENNVEEAKAMAVKDGVTFLLNISSRWAPDRYDPFEPKNPDLKLGRIYD